jgi:hypothetical protein
MIDNKIVAFVGDSAVAGLGWDKDNLTKSCYHSDHLWTNLCINNITQLQHSKSINLAVQNASNTVIFNQACNALSKHNVDYLFCCWAQIQRYTFNPGLELYPTELSFSQKFTSKILGLNDIEYSTRDLEKMITKLRTMHHPHYEILKIVNYANILSALGNKLNTKVIHVNLGCPWDKDYFKPKFGPSVLPSDYTEFTQEILYVDNRDDDEIKKLYEKIHHDYSNEGGIDESNWVSLDQPLTTIPIDYNHDGKHPGIKTNQLVFEKIKQFMSGWCN